MRTLEAMVSGGPVDNPRFCRKAWFTLVNDSGYTIDYMYVRPVGDPDSSDDVLG